jgi:MFS transporter, DHA1 family, inner membrane transport protein
MSFFGNGAINRVNLHTGIQALADGAGGIFVMVFLLQVGVPLPLVFLSQGAMTAVRFLARSAVVPLARRIGIKGTLITGTVLEAGFMPMVPLVQGPDVWLLALIVGGSLGSALYWTSYHAYFASLGDAEHRGGQIGAREALTAMVSIIAPLIGGWALATGGPWPLFVAAGLVQLLSAIPLLGLPNVAVAAGVSSGREARWKGAVITMTDGWLAAGYHFVWQIALFVSLGESFRAYGGAMALAGVAGAACGLVVGRLVDLGHGRRSTLVAYGVGAVVLGLRAISVDTPWLAVSANALGALFVALQATVMMTPVYNLAQQSPCPLRFHVATEGGWDIGCTLACFAAAALTAAGQPLSVSILLGMVGGTASVALLWRAYRS